MFISNINLQNTKIKVANELNWIYSLNNDGNKN